MARASLLIREKGKTGKGTSEREKLLMWVTRTTGAVPWGLPGATSERVQSAPIGKGSGWPRGKADIAMLEFTTLSVGFVLRLSSHFLHEVTFLCEFFFAVNGFSTSCRESKRYANTPRSRFPFTDRT